MPIRGADMQAGGVPLAFGLETHVANLPDKLRGDRLHLEADPGMKIDPFRQGLIGGRKPPVFLAAEIRRRTSAGLCSMVAARVSDTRTGANVDGHRTGRDDSCQNCTPKPRSPLRTSMKPDSPEPTSIADGRRPVGTASRRIRAMFERLRRFVPTREQIESSRWLRWLGPRLLHPRLWHFSRRGVAVGVGLGVFFGLLIPVAQIPLAAGTAVILRANVPAAAASTLVTNPVTFAPVYMLAHRLGATLIGDDARQATAAAEASRRAAQIGGADLPWWQKIWKRATSIGKPLLLGLAIVSVIAGLLTYAVIMVAWRIRTALAWRRRRRRSVAAR